MSRKRLARVASSAPLRAASPTFGGEDLQNARANFAREFSQFAGYSFHNRRNMYRILGYQRQLQVQDYRARYERNAIAARVVEAMPKATWRGGAEIVEDENPDVETAFELAFDALNKRLRVWSVFQRADILSGLGHYSVILLGTPGDFSTELGRGNPNSLAYLTPFAEDDAKVVEWDTDTKSVRFGQPVRYMLRRLNAPVSPTNLGLPVHYTRVIHIADNALDDTVFGTPRLQRSWNLFDDLEKVTGGGAEAFWLRANQGLHLNMDPSVEFSAEAAAALKSQADEYQHEMRRMLRTRGVEVNPLGSDVADFSKPADAILTQIAGGEGIPKRILTGSERGELASTQDRNNWHSQVTDRRASFADPVCVRPFIDRLIAYGYLSTPAEYKSMWPEVANMDENERADIAQKWANINVSMPGEIQPGEIRDRILDLPPLTPEQMQHQEELVAKATAEKLAPEPGDRQNMSEDAAS